MTGIGKTLRQAREEQQLTLVEIENKTKIRRRYLEALEAEDFDIFPGNVYMFGFIRNYAAFLNLNGEELVEILKTNLGESEEDPKPKKIVANYTHFDKKSYNFAKLFKYLFILILLVLVVLYLFTYFTGKPSNEIILPNDVIEGTIDENETEIDQSEIDAIEESIVENIRLLLIVSEEQGARCWVEAKIDGELNYSGILESGEKRSFQAKEKINIRFGNAGVVSLVYNDENIGVAGPINKVVDLEFPPKVLSD